MTSKAVANKPQTLTSAELNALLQEQGVISKPSSEKQERISVSAAMLTTSDDGEMYVYNPKKPEQPAMTVRILRPVEEYNAIWIDNVVASSFGRPDLANTFSKNFFEPREDRRIWPSDEVYDELARANLFDSKGKEVKGSWKGDLYVQILPESGTLQGDETAYVITLPTTSLIEFRGSSKAPDEGAISDVNFIHKLMDFAQEGAEDPRKAVLDALTSYQLGGVVAEIRIGEGENKERGQRWPVLVFDPVHIEPMVEGDNLLASGDEEDI